MVLSLLSTLTWAADCEPPNAVLDEAFDYAVRGRFSESRIALTEAERRFKCAQITPEQIHRFWIIEAITLVGEDRNGAAERAFAAAKVIQPSTFPDQLGTKLKTLWSDATPLQGSGLIELVPVLEEGRTGWLDGAQVTWPTTAPAGPHWVQVVEDEQVRFAEVLMVNPQQAHTLQTPLQPLSVPVDLQPTRRRSVWPIVGATGLALGTGSLIAASLERRALLRSDSPEDAVLHQNRKTAYASAGWTLIGAGSVIIGVDIAF